MHYQTPNKGINEQMKMRVDSEVKLVKLSLNVGAYPHPLHDLVDGEIRTKVFNVLSLSCTWYSPSYPNYRGVQMQSNKFSWYQGNSGNQGTQFVSGVTKILPGFGLNVQVAQFSPTRPMKSTTPVFICKFCKLYKLCKCLLAALGLLRWVR